MGRNTANLNPTTRKGFDVIAVSAESKDWTPEIAKLERLSAKAEAIGTPDALKNAADYRRRIGELNAMYEKAVQEIDLVKVIDGGAEIVERKRDWRDTATSAQLTAEYNSWFVKKERPRKDWSEICTAARYRETDPRLLPAQGPYKAVAAWQYQERGLILTGPSGLGKTRAAWLLMRRLHEEGRNILAFDGFGWTANVARAFMDVQNLERWMDGLTYVDMLFLDDVFRGKFTDAQELALWGVIERRTANKMPIIVTLNATGESLKADYGASVEPIIRRMREFCDSVSFNK